MLDILEHVTGWAIREIALHPDAVDVERVQSFCNLLERALRASYMLLPQHLIHRDPNPANMLFLGNELTAWLDFDMVTYSARIFDPCYCATSILVGGWQAPENRNTWPRLLAALLNSYARTHSLTEVEMRAVFPILLAIQLMFMAFSLRQKENAAARCNGEVLVWLVDNQKRIETDAGKASGAARGPTGDPRVAHG